MGKYMNGGPSKRALKCNTGGVVESPQIIQYKFGRIFVVNLKSREDRFDVFRNIKNVERFEALDTRYDRFKFLEYDFKLNPINLIYKDYFSIGSGGVGCFISHYLIWNKIIDEDIPYALILEDDADASDLEKLLDMIDLSEFEGNDIVQLNKRSKIPFFHNGGFVGTESYIITKSGCEKLLKHVNSPKYIIDTFIPPVVKRKGVLLDIDLVPMIRSDEVSQKTIILPLDVFIGYAACKDIPSDIRLNIGLYPCIGLNRCSISSDITNTPHSKGFYAMDSADLQDLRKGMGNMFEWWSNDSSRALTFRNKFVGIVASYRSGSTTLCEKFDEVDGVVVLNEGFSETPKGFFRNYSSEEVTIGRILDRVAEDPSINPGDVIVFKIMASQLSDAEIDELFKLGNHLSIIQHYRDPEKSYRSYIDSLLRGNWGTTPENKTLMQKEVDMYVNCTGGMSDIDSIIDFDTFKTNYYNWSLKFSNKCEQLKISSVKTKFYEVIKKDFNAKELLNKLSI